MLTPELYFDAAEHRYSIGGIELPSVTSCIDWLNNYAGVPAHVLEHAREIGEAVHVATALNDRDDLVEESVHPTVRPYLEAWRRFRYDSGFIVELCEQSVYSRAHWFAGTLDRVGHFAPTKASGLIEIKTTAKIMPGNGAQTAAYKKCLAEMGYPDAVDLRRYTVLLGDDGRYRIREHTDHQDINVFLCSLTLANWRKNNRITEGQ